jgi:hypothetical protein
VTGKIILLGLCKVSHLFQTCCIYVFFLVMSWDSSVSIVPGYGMNDRYSIPWKITEFSLLHRV